MLAVGAGQGGVAAVEQRGVARVPVFDDLQALVDFAAQRWRGQVVAGEDRTDGQAEFLQRGVGGVLGSTAGEPAQDLFGLGGTQP